MTVNSYYYQKPTTVNFLPKINTNINLKKIKRIGSSCILKDSKSYSGIVLGVFLGLCIVFISAFIYAQSINADLDYRITDLKKSLSVLEAENANLKTAFVEHISPDAIAIWAEQNGFVKNTDFSHFEINKPSTLSLNVNH